MRVKVGKAYKYQAIVIDNSQKNSEPLQQLSSVIESWGNYLDLYTHRSTELFDGGESLFCRGTEQMCMASIGSALHRENKLAVSAIEIPDPGKDTKSGGTGRVDLWLHTGSQQFYVEGKLRRKSITVSQILTTFVGSGGKGSASSLISTGFRDYQKSTGTWSRIRRTNQSEYSRVMLLMVRFDYEKDAQNFNAARDELKKIFSSPEKITIYRNERTRGEAKPVIDSLGKYDHVVLLMTPTGEIALHDTHNKGLIAVASIIQSPKRYASKKT